jgi:predicted small secreted protein
MTLVKRGLHLVILAAIGFTLAACENTIRGAGQDIEETGEAVEDAVAG